MKRQGLRRSFSTALMCASFVAFAFPATVLAQAPPPSRVQPPVIIPPSGQYRPVIPQWSPRLESRHHKHVANAHTGKPRIARSRQAVHKPALEK